MSNRNRIEYAIRLLRQAVGILTGELPDDQVREMLLAREAHGELREIRDTTTQTLSLLRGVNAYAAQTLKASCPGCDRDLMLRIVGNNVVLECYNPDINEHNRRGIAERKWTLTPTQVA